jgi:RNA polymerase sigma-70 factor, ECF subfamily
MSVPFHELSDAVLVTQVARGNPGALAEIYRRHGGCAFRLAGRLLNDQRLAEDICQDVFLQLWNSPDLYDGDRGSLRSWILMKTHSRSVDSIRASSARFSRENRELNDASTRDYDLEREVWDLTVADRIQRALGELPPNEKDAVQLAYFGGLTYREVAQRLGEPEGTVKSRIRNGLKSLGRLLNDLHHDGTHEPPPRSLRGLTPTSADSVDHPNGNEHRSRWGR